MDIVLLLHSLVRFVLLLLAVIGIILAVVSIARQAPPVSRDRAIGSAFVGFFDLQVLLGLLIILLGGLNQAIHPIVMFIGVVAAHGLQSAGRKAPGNRAHWLRLALFVVPLLIILIGLASISHLPY